MSVDVLYVGSYSRSGSTLLDRMLGQFPGLVSMGEINYVWSRGLFDNQLCGCGERFGDCPFWARVGLEAFGGWDELDLLEILRLENAVVRHRRIPFMLAPGIDPSFARDLERFRSYLGRLYRAVQDVSGARVLVDSSKSPTYAFVLRGIPSIRLEIAHLVRDSRGVAYSFTKEVRRPEVVDRVEYMPRRHPAATAMRWTIYNALFHLLERAGVPRTFVRYESLVDDPRTELQRVLGELGEEVDPAQLAFIAEGQAELSESHTISGNPMRFHGGKLKLAVDDKWRRALSPRRRAAVSAISAPMLVSYGYFRPRRPAPERTAQARR